MKDFKCVLDFQIRIYFYTENKTKRLHVYVVERVAKSSYYRISMGPVETDGIGWHNPVLPTNTTKML